MSPGVLTWTLLALCGLVGGIGITAVGPGGVLPTIGLFTLTALPPAAVAGTALVTHIATGLLGSAAYLRSGQLRRPATRRTALVLALTAAPATLLGTRLNALLPRSSFGLLLGAFVLLVVVLMAYRRRLDRRAGDASAGAGASEAGASEAGASGHPGPGWVLGLGFAVAVVAGIIGIGGPMLTVPLLVGLGVPILESLAAAQVQSVVVAVVGSVSYLAAGSIDWRLAALVGVPELAGVLVGWRVARAVPERQLQVGLAVTLLVLVPCVVLTRS
jgi:hypothetical protein